ncbi:MAG: O-antigen ligase family protein [Alphaproteobacteria bacterium]|nr:O-antigen ligase family protein [Alphaproteobacteria bacterium]
MLLIAQWLTALIPPAMIAGQAVPEILIGIIIGLFLLHSFRARDWQWLRKDWFVILFVLWAYMVVRGAFAVDAQGSVERVLPWLHYPVFIAALVNWVLRDMMAQRRLLISLTITVIFLVADALWQYYSGHDVFGRSFVKSSVSGLIRLTGPFENPRIGITLVWIAFPVLLYLCSRIPSPFKKIDRAALPKALRWMGLSVVVITGTLVAIYLSGERMAFLLCLAGLGLGTLLSRQSRWVFVASIILGFSLLATISASNPKLEERQVVQSSAAISNYWKTAYGQTVLSALAIWKANPWTGVGIKNFRAVCSNPEYGPTTERELHLRCPLHPHNLYMEWLAETGAIGFILFFWAVGLWVARCYRERRKILEDPVLTGLFITAVIRFWPLATMTSQFFPWSAAPFWLLIGFLLARLDGPERKTPHT